MDAATFHYIEQARAERERLDATPSWRLLLGGMLSFTSGLIGSKRVLGCAHRIVGNPDQGHGE